jgi:Arc/MetJ-type ribon-helix-helix transcriptional regulator
MTIQLKPDTERLVQEELKRGHFQSVDELIVQGVQAWREKYHPQRTRAEARDAVDRALEFAKHRAVPLKGISIKELIHEGHRV